MSNLATLRGFLQSTLRDSSNVTWTTTEMDNALTRAINTLYPRIAKTNATVSVTLVSGTYFYTPATALIEIDKIEWIDTDSNEMGELAPGTWEYDRENTSLHIAPNIVEAGGTLRLYGFVAYTSSDTIPAKYDPLVLAKAEVELLHMMKSDRARFENWAGTQQTQNISVNELLQAINAAEQRARELSSGYFTWRRPRPGRR